MGRFREPVGGANRRAKRGAASLPSRGPNRVSSKTPSKRRRHPAVTGARIVGYAGMGGISEAKPSSRLRGTGLFYFFSQFR